jgi:hypothetical protein
MLPLNQAEKVKAGQIWLNKIMSELSVVLPRWCQYMISGITVALEEFDTKSPAFILQVWKQTKPFYDDFNRRLTELLEISIPAIEKKVVDVVGSDNLNVLKAKYIKANNQKYELPEIRGGNRVSDIEDSFYSLMTNLQTHFKNGPVFTMGTPNYIPPEAIAQKINGKTMGGSNMGKEFNYLSEVNVLITFIKGILDENTLANRVYTLSARLEKGIYTLINAYQDHHRAHVTKSFQKFVKKPIKNQGRIMRDLKYDDPA